MVKKILMKIFILSFLFGIGFADHFLLTETNYQTIYPNGDVSWEDNTWKWDMNWTTVQFDGVFILNSSTTILEFAVKPKDNFEQIKFWLTMNEIETGENSTIGFELRNSGKAAFALFYSNPNEPEQFFAFGLSEDKLNIRVYLENSTTTAFFETKNEHEMKFYEYEGKNLLSTENGTIINFDFLVETLDGTATIEIPDDILGFEKHEVIQIAEVNNAFINNISFIFFIMLIFVNF
uniref:Uncharacterized protein n=1 Tax=Panagrolaimus sp. JU765 TaxID=591449 RepID=A0AC34QS11_9BILA